MANTISDEGIQKGFCFVLKNAVTAFPESG